MIEGLVVVDKAAGWTSHDVVAKCRKIFGQKRVGHSGTLDPDATGVLLIGLGRFTRMLRFLTDLPKSYAGEIVLGTATSTLDAGGEVVGEWDMAGVGLEDVRAAAAGFVGEIEQVPPMVSAVQVGGRRLHELARDGIEVERAARRVTVSRFDVAPGDGAGVFSIAVDCSSGTYIRSLAADVGTELGGGAHLRALRRTAIGSFGLDDAVAIDILGPDHVLPPVEGLRDYPAVTATEATALDVAHGKVLDDTTLGVTGSGPWRVLDASGALLAMYQRHRGTTVKPAAVIALAD